MHRPEGSFAPSIWEMSVEAFATNAPSIMRLLMETGPDLAEVNLRSRLA
jgi:hypothetical protein